MTESLLREKMCLLAKSLFDRGLAGGSSGNISVRTADGGLLVSPTGSTFGSLYPAELSRFDAKGRQVDGLTPTKEMPLHTAFYDTRPTTGAVVHLHSSYSVALSMMPGVDPDNFIPPFTAYSIIRLGKVKLLPYYRPGDPALGDAVRALRGKRAAIMLANHGPVVSGRHLDGAVSAIEELEETAKLAMLVRGFDANMLTPEQIRDVVTHFNVEWD